VFAHSDPARSVLVEGAAVRFREVQTRTWYWVLPLLLGAIFLGPLIRESLSNPSRINMVSAVLYPTLFVWTLLSQWRRRLIIEVWGDVLDLYWTRHLRVQVPLSAIESVEVVSFYPALDGPWGVHKGQGLRIRVAGGSTWSFGTRRAEELRSLLLAPAAAAAA
jgi:hypothetical protein